MGMGKKEMASMQQGMGRQGRRAETAYQGCYDSG